MRHTIAFIGAILLALAIVPGTPLAQAAHAQAVSNDPQVAIIRDGTNKWGPCLTTTTIHLNTAQAQTTQSPCAPGTLLYVDYMLRSEAIAMAEPYVIVPPKTTATYSAQLEQLYNEKLALIVRSQRGQSVQPLCVTGAKEKSNQVFIGNGLQSKVYVDIYYDIPNCSQVYLDTSDEELVQGYNGYNRCETWNSYGAGGWNIDQPLTTTDNPYFVNETHTIDLYFVFGFQDPDSSGNLQCYRQDYKINLGPLT